MADKGISKTMLSKQTGLRYDLANRYYNNELERFGRSVIAKICYSLEYIPGDLLFYSCGYITK
ncbi:helix-turn-helix transcriptional regulator [Eubacteriales bacterium OttesenSCG-928-M02]|nr:helix-turn-helix transcriptional regulator [Eubacteriales bacterium OttesenSCG-928-M02]